MVSLTLSIPEELKREMEMFPEMNWSVIAREAIRRKIALLNELDKIVKKSRLTEKDALELGRKVNKNASKKFFK